MLKIYFGEMPEEDNVLYIYDTATFFKNVYEDEWIISDFGKEIIKTVDKSEVKSASAISSPVFGTIEPSKLSSGTMTLLLVNFMKEFNGQKTVFNCTCCGDNCMKYLLQIGERQDVLINLRCLPEFGDSDFTIEIANNGKIVKNMAELVWEGGEFV